MRIVGSEAEAEDIVQDSFLKWRQTDRTALLTPAAWLTTVAWHGSIDRLRKRAREAAALVAHELVPGETPALPEAELLRETETGEALARLLARLSPSERLAPVRRFQAAIDGMDVPAVVTLLLDERPMSVRSAPAVRPARGPCANDALYRVAAFA